MGHPLQGTIEAMITPLDESKREIQLELKPIPFIPQRENLVPNT